MIIVQDLICLVWSWNLKVALKNAKQIFDTQFNQNT